MSIKETIATLALIGALVGFSGCERGIEQKAQAEVAQSQATPCTTDSDCEKKEPKEAHYCAGITKKGERCKRRVKVEGDYCWMHVGQDKRGK